MRDNTKCYIVEYSDGTRQACIEGLPTVTPEEITVVEEEKEILMRNAWPATIGFARLIRKVGTTQGKSMNFKVVVQRKDEGTLRFALDSEWILALKRRKNRKRALGTQISKMRSKKKEAKPRGKVGPVS